MKKITLLFLLSTLNFLTYSQVNNVKEKVLTELKTIEYSNGREIFNICKSIKEISFNENLEYYWFNEFSKIKSTKGSAGGNLLHGKYQLFNEKGNLTAEANFYLGLKDGSEKTWSEDGEIKINNKYNKGKLIYTKFKSEDKESFIEWIGNATAEGSIKNIYTTYGKLKQTQKWLKDFKYKVTSYHLNGKVKSIFTTDPFDKMYDECIEYYENGKMKLYGKYENNWRIGQWKWFDENGIIESTEQNRIKINYSKDNIIISKGGEYFDTTENEWLKNGLWIWYEEDGKNILDMKKFKYGEEIDFVAKKDE